MAAIVRRVWSALRDEAILAAGGHAYTGYSGRMEYWLTESYYDLCALVHHYELDNQIPVTLATDAYEIPVPDDCYIVVGVCELDSGGLVKRFLTMEHARVAKGVFRNERGPLMSWSRFGDAITFNALAKQETQLKLMYYRRPLAPDFAAVSPAATAYPEISWLWDSHLVDAAVARAQRRIWRPDLGAFNAQALSAWLDDQIQAQSKDQPILSQPDAALTNDAIGGKQ